MDGGSLNLRNDEVFDKLDSAPRKDVNKLIQLQKETNANNIAKQRRDSLNAIEESLFKLDIFEEDASKTFNDGAAKDEHKETKEREIFESIVNNLSADNDSFLKKIETLYNILFKSYKSELIIRKKLGSYHGSINDADEYVKNRILGRIIFNIEYFRNFTKEYEKYDFEDVINQIKRIPESSMSKEDNSIHIDVCNILNTTITSAAVDSIINNLKISIQYGGVQKLKSSVIEASLNKQNSNGINSPQSIIKASTPTANIIASTPTANGINSPQSIIKASTPTANIIASTPTANGINSPQSIIKASTPTANIIASTPTANGIGSPQSIIKASTPTANIIASTPTANGIGSPQSVIKASTPTANIIASTPTANGIGSPQSVIKASTPTANVIASQQPVTNTSSSSLQPDPSLNNWNYLSDKVNTIAATLFEKYASSFTKLRNGNFNTIEQGVKLIMHILLVVGSTKSKPGLEGGAPTKTTESNLLEYVKRAGENAILVLTKDITISKTDAEHEITNLILIQTFLSKNLDNKVNFYVLEVFYGIIYGTLLSYDLRLKEENKYIVERVENINQVYSIINDIIYDQTYRTLKQLYNKKYPGYRNIFRIDSLYNDVFTRSEINIPKKSVFIEEKEYRLRDLVILKINNGAVNIKDFQRLLKNMYNKNDYQVLYEYLHELTNIYNLYSDIVVLTVANYNTGVKKENLKGKIEKLQEINTDKLQEMLGATGNVNLSTVRKTLDSLLNDDATQDNLSTLESTLTDLKAKTTERLNKPTPSESSDGPGAGAGAGSNDNDLVKVITSILDLDSVDTTSTPAKNETDKFSGLFNAYINKTKKMGGTNITPIPIHVPVSHGIDADADADIKKNESVCHSSIEAMSTINLKVGGDYEQIKIKKEELKAKLENPTVDDDITESVTDNAKRKLNKVKNNIKQFFNTTENVEADIPKVLDEEYLNELKTFNINDVKTQSYKELRKNLYRIKNNEYFEDIKITNEDIYTFIATTYVLRVISLYITMWFIQIEIVKDVESVIVAYILTYILLFILIYTFVNLSDNQLDTSKSFLYYFYSRVNFSYTRFIVHLGLLLLLIIIPFVIRTIDKESASYKHISDTEKRYLYTFITNMSTIVWVILSIIAFFFK